METVTGSTVLTLWDSQLAVPASNCTLCGYVLEYHSAFFVNYIHCLLYYFIPTFDINAVNFLHRNTNGAIVLHVCSFSLIVSSVQVSVHRTCYIHFSILKI